MATDIDIEEHDVLQSSKVMGIFPDLSLVKTEVLDDDEQDNTAQHLPINPEAIPDSTTGYDSPLDFERVSESPHVVTSTQEDGTTLTPKIIGIQSTSNCFNNRIVLGQKSTTLASVEDEQINKSQPEDGTSVTETFDVQDELQTLGDTALEAVNNCIVFGQKPSRQPSVSIETDIEINKEELMKCYSARVTLDNWGPYLNSSDSYCSECEILFATVNALDAHKMIAHSFLVAVEAKEPIASTGKTFDPKKACFVCQKSFTNHAELIQHIYHHVSTTQECSECKKTFLSKNLLTEHMKTHVKSKEVPSAPKLTKGGDSLYTCKICGQCHASLFSVKRHITKAHSRVSVTSEDYVVVDVLRCAVCDHTCHGIAAFNAHSLKHKESPKSKDAGLAMATKPLSGLPHGGVDFVPKSTLFSCSECDTHFTSLAVAFSHQESCPETKSQDCQQCPLAIASACIGRHRIQHMFADNTEFDIINFDSENLTEKILCVCPKCEQNCSVQSLWNHVSTCPVTASYHCPVCDIYLDKTTEQDHRFAHDAHRFSKDDFITIAYVNAEDLEAGKARIQNVIKVGSKRKLDAHAESQSSKLSKVETPTEIDKEFFYCENCRIFIPKTGMTKKKSHIAGACRPQIQQVCFTCGLVFARYSIAMHARLHENKDFTFDNFKFFDLKSRQMRPPLPEYPQCRKCKCYFLQHSTAQRHSCPSKDAVKCSICNNTYSQMAYNLHMKFHGANLSLNKVADKRCNKKMKRLAAAKASRPNLERSDEDGKSQLKESQDLERLSKSFLLFYCVECKCCFSGDSHKYLRENCAQSVAIRYRHRTCEMCGIVVMIEKYKSHLSLHDKYNVTLKDFEFFNMEKVRLLNPPVPNYYQCKTCKVHFHTSVQSRNHACDSKAGQLCKVCKLKFSPTALRLHAPFHQFNTKPSSKCYLVYQCTKCTYVFSKHQVANRHSCLGPKKASSHQYCEICHLTMYKGVYEQHLDKHDGMRVVLFDPNVTPPRPNAVTMYCGNCEIGYDLEIKQKKKTRPCPDCGRTLSTKKTKAQLAKPIRPKSKLLSQSRYIFHQCMFCKETIRKRENMKMHMTTCGLKRKAPVPLSHCKICDMHIKQNRFHCHLRSHRRYPNLSKDTVTIIQCGKTQRRPFVLYTEAKTAQARYTFYQCRNCSGTVTQIQRFKTHKCAEMAVVHLTNCPACKLNVLLSGYAAHMKMHSEHPDMTLENIHIVPFGEKRGARSVIVAAEFAATCSDFIYRTLNKADDSDVCVEVEEDKKSSDDIEPPEGAKYTLYRCNKCLGCVSTEQKAEMHTKNQPQCREIKRDRCKLCKLQLVKFFMRYHMEKHMSDPEFTRDNMRIVNFGEVSECPEPSPRLKYILYQCSECLVCSDEQYEHLCENVERRTCDICQYDIEASYFSRHYECHKNDNYQRSAMRILPLDLIGDAGSVSDKQDAPLRKRKLGGALVQKKTVDVYRCSCGLHFLCRKSLEKHDFMCQGVAKETSGLPCSKCHLVFDASQLLKHSISHHGNLGFDIKYNVIESDSNADQCSNCHTEFMKGDICPKCVTPKKVGKKKRPKKSCPKCDLVVAACNFSRHLLRHLKMEQLSRCAQKKINKFKKTNSNRTATQNKAGNSEMTNTRRANITNRTGIKKTKSDVEGMFKCSLCQVHFMNENAYISHTKYRLKGEHFTPPKINCKVCNVLILRSDITHHSLSFHDKGNLYQYSNILYYCAKCPIYFLTLSSLRRHGYGASNRRHNTVPSQPCHHCGLRFSRLGMKIHVSVHHDAHKFKREDFIIKNRFNETITGTEKDLDRVGDSGDMNSADDNLDNAPSADESRDDLASANEADDRASEALQIKMEGDPGDSEQTDVVAEGALHNYKKADGEPSVVGIKEPRNKGLRYYKCKECNVHFLRYTIIQKHLSNHRPMPEYDFLECKLCKLNFIVNSLRTHMDHHKNKNFTLEQVRFFEFDKKSKSGVAMDKVVDEIKGDENSSISEEKSQAQAIDEIKDDDNSSIKSQTPPSDATSFPKGVLEQLLTDGRY